MTAARSLSWGHGRRLRHLALAGLGLVGLVAAGCSSTTSYEWAAVDRPTRVDLGALAPEDDAYQRLITDVEVTIDFPDGRRHTISAENLWVDVVFPEGDVPAAEHEVRNLEFRQVVGLDDNELVPALARFAAMVDYEFDEEAATEWVLSNDGGFSLPVTGYREDQYRIYLTLDDTEFDNVVRLHIDFPRSNEGRFSSTAPEESQEFDLDNVLFDGRSIGS